MKDFKENYEIKYFNDRWRVFYKNHEIPMTNAHYGSRVEAEMGLDKEIEYWNKSHDNVNILAKEG